jgi:hypothetical protein
MVQYKHGETMSYFDDFDNDLDAAFDRARKLFFASFVLYFVTVVGTIALLAWAVISLINYYGL